VSPVALTVGTGALNEFQGFDTILHPHHLVGHFPLLERAHGHLSIGVAVLYQ
jgi:hypothetical protein